MLEGMAMKGCIVWPGVYGGASKREREREKEKVRENRRLGASSKTNVTHLSVLHAALQASAWWLIQHNDEP